MTQKKGNPWCFGKMFVPMRTTLCDSCEEELRVKCNIKSRSAYRK
jgi:hypothetical protein